MDIETFTRLDFRSREDVVLETGKFVADRRVNKYRILLYAINRLYVEVWCLTSTLQIDQIIPLANPNVFDLYVRHLNMKTLMRFLN